MIFRQLFEPISSTYTYLLGCEKSGKAVLVDPVLPAWERDLEELRRLGLELAFTVDTHIHADHITAARKLKLETGSLIAHPRIDGLTCTDFPLEEGKPLEMGSIRLDPIFTPGHTDGHHAYRTGDRVLTGDALLIDGCGRTDFQNGDARVLYHSLQNKLFVLADDTLVYPGHDYNQRRVSSVAQEKARNPRIGGDRDLEAFVKLMSELDLAYPKFIDYAVPGNRECGVCPSDVPEDLEQYCDQIGESRQG